MVDTTFVDGETLIEASWLNDVNDVVYNPAAALIPASSIVNTPAGDIAATDVQTALNELDTEKQPIDALLTALAAQTTAANNVQAYSGADTPTLLSTGTASGNIPLVGIKSATTTLAGLVEKATQAEAEAGTDDTVFPSVLGVAQEIATLAFPISTIRVGTANGYGSTNTAIRRYTNTLDTAGSDITYADSAANGSSFTINTTGMYSISSSESLAGQTFFGISKNSSQLTTAIQSITEADRLTISCVATTDVPGNCGVTVYLTAGDVIRPHGQGVGGTGAYPATVTMTVSRVG